MHEAVHDVGCAGQITGVLKKPEDRVEHGENGDECDYNARLRKSERMMNNSRAPAMAILAPLTILRAGMSIRPRTIQAADTDRKTAGTHLSFLETGPSCASSRLMSCFALGKAVIPLGKDKRVR